MNIFRHIFFLFLYIISYSVFAQSNDPVLVRINGDIEITKSELEYAYKKDASYSKNDNKNLENFLRSYINFKLSVEEAKQQGLDKQKDFASEYSNYVEQLEKPYLIDSISPESLAKDIYNRLKENIKISHIFLGFSGKNILPKDTVEIYNKAVNIRKSINNKPGDSFEDFVTKYSEDSISKNSSSPGYIGWKTAFSMRYPVEKIMYNLPLNTISDPIRTTKGYHIIKVQDKRLDPGQFNIAQIVVVYPRLDPTPQEKDSVQNLAMDIYNKLLEGENFNELCYQYSADEQTYMKGGNLGWFGVNRPIPDDFEKTLFGMNTPGEITAPIEAYYGYHIFKLIAKTPLLPWEAMKDNLIDAIKNSDRNEVLTMKEIKLLAVEYPYNTVEETYTELEKVANKYTLSDTTYFNTIFPIFDNTLLKINNHSYTVRDFIHYIEKNPSSDYSLSTDVLQYKFNEFILDRLIEEKRLDLPNKYPDFRYLSQEFYEGILFFNIMNENVWQKAQTDRQALEKLFKMDFEKYKWDSPKYKGLVIHARNKDIISRVNAIIKENKDNDNLQTVLNNTFNNDSIRNVIVEKGLWAKGDNPYVDRLFYKTDTPNRIIDFPEVMIEGRLINEPENVNDVTGTVTSDYQSILEKQWYDALRKKYKVEIDDNIFDIIK